MSAGVLVAIGGFAVVVFGGSWALLRFGSWRLLGMVVLGLVVTTALAVWRYAQRPQLESMPCALPTAPGELGSICGFVNPEDLHHLPSMGIVLVSEEGFGGRLLSLDLDDLTAGPRVLWPPAPDALQRLASRGGDLGDARCPFPSDPARLWPHGLSALEANEPGQPVRIAFVSHRLVDDVITDSVQFFDFDPRGDESLVWRGCLDFPDDVIGNDLALLRDGSLVATNFAPRGTMEQLQRTVRRGGLGFATGDILRWSPSDGWTHLPNTRGALPNGVAVSPDERSLYFADAGNSQVVVMALDGGGDIVRMPVGGAPNNLTVTPGGLLLAAGATLSGDVPFVCGIGGRECRVGWAVWEIDPRTRSVVEVVAEPGRQLSNATTALQVDDTLLIGSMADTRVGVYRRR